MQSFFDYNADFPYAGFKSMPNRHTTYDAFITGRLISQQSSVEKLDNVLRGMGEVEALLGEPDGFGLGGVGLG